MANDGQALSLADAKELALDARVDLLTALAVGMDAVQKGAPLEDALPASVLAPLLDSYANAAFLAKVCALGLADVRVRGVVSEEDGHREFITEVVPPGRQAPSGMVS
jgi:hypothetical protein